MLYNVKCVCIFFFKQKTAYEMRISDWSSDVCSSDLDCTAHERTSSVMLSHESATVRCSSTSAPGSATSPMAMTRSVSARGLSVSSVTTERARFIATSRSPVRARRPSTSRSRSEEHTSELQSLMRISYAVFCLKKKNIHT